MKLWFVYILECADGTLYTGITTDLDRRLAEHNEGRLGARYTRARRPVTLRYSEQFENRSEASKAEAVVKKKSRGEKRALITSGS
jgi:putative endonuclease